MPDRNRARSGHDTVILLALLAVLLFASPFTDWWARAGLPWYFPFLLWGLLILLVALSQWLARAYED